MDSEAAAPVEGEVRAVAELLGRHPDELTAIKVPGPGRLGESVLTVIGQLPELDGFAPPERMEIEWTGDPDGYRFAARYDSPDGSLVIVSHETGPLIFFAGLSGMAGAFGAAAGNAVIEGAKAFVKWVHARRGRGGEPIQFFFVEGGRVKSRETLRLEPPD